MKEELSEIEYGTSSSSENTNANASANVPPTQKNNHPVIIPIGGMYVLYVCIVGVSAKR